MQEYQEFTNGLKHTLVNLSFTDVQHFFGLEYPGKYQKMCLSQKVTYFTRPFGYPLTPLSKTNTKNHSRWMLKEKQIIHFYHSPRLLLCRGTSHRHKWIN